MPTRKIGELPKDFMFPARCTHPEHDPPKHMVYQQGIYEHECPGCHRVVQFVVDQGAIVGAPVDIGKRSPTPPPAFFENQCWRNGR